MAAQAGELGQAVERTLGALQVGGGHVGVALGGAQAPVAEQGLDHANIRPALQHVGGTGVPQGVGRDVLGDLGAPAGAVEEAMDARAREGAAVGPWEEQRRGALRPPVLLKNRAQVGREHDVAVLASLALLDADHHALAIDVGDTEVGPSATRRPPAYMVMSRARCLRLVVIWSSEATSCGPRISGSVRPVR